MYYEKINESWEKLSKKSVYFNGSTYPIESLPAGFWNADRMKAADTPPHDATTQKLVGPQEIGGGFVGYVVEALTPEEQEVKLQQKREMMIVSPWQFRKALNMSNKRGAVNAVIVQADQDVKDGWEVATSFERIHPMVISFGMELGMTNTELDELFELAATL